MPTTLPYIYIDKSIPFHRKDLGRSFSYKTARVEKMMDEDKRLALVSAFSGSIRGGRLVTGGTGTFSSSSSVGIRRAKFKMLFLFLFLSWALSVTSSVTYDHKAVIIDGKRRILFSGSIHYPRSTPEVTDRPELGSVP